MNKKQIIVLWALILILVPIFLYNLYEIGKWKETIDQSAYSINEMRERQKVIQLSGMAASVLLGIAGFLIYRFHDKKNS